MRPTFIFAALTTLSFVVAAPQASAQTATWYISTYTDQMLVWDEESEEIIDRVQMNHNIPNDVRLNETSTRLYVGEASGQYLSLIHI